MKVAVVIPTYNRREELARCVQAVAELEYPDDQCEIIVVDNSSTDGTAETVRELQRTTPCPVHYLMIPPGGPAIARNVGGARAGAKVDAVAFVDSDVLLDREWLRSAVSVLKSRESVGIVSGKLLYASHADRINAFGGALGRIGLAWDRHEGEEEAQITEPVHCLWASGAALLVRRSLLEATGGLDETFFYGYEDTDFGWRVNLIGFQVLCTPDCVAHHCVGDAIGPSDPLIVYHYCKNRLRSMLKNSGTGRLLCYLPIYVPYALVDAVLRYPRWAKFKALLWNLGALRDTLRQRRHIQRTRAVSDGEIEHLFSRRYFPPVPLRGRRRRPVDELAGQVVSPTRSSDDRVH